MVRGRLRIPLAVIAAVAVAEVAVLLLRPGHGVIKPADVDPRAYFSNAQIQRAQDFRRPQIWLHGATLLIEGGLLVYLVVRRPRALERRFRRPVLAAALTAAALSVTLAAATLPVALVSRERAKEVGLITQDLTGYATDLAKGWVVAALIAGVGGSVAIVLMRRLPRGWWVPGAAIVVAFGVGTIYAGPVVIDPLFNRFEPSRPAVRGDVLRLAGRAGVDVGDVLEVDASQRTTAANAYVTGIGHTKRVVLYDNLVDNFSRDELNAVVAHELAHVKYDDVRSGLLYLLVVAPVGMWAVALITRELMLPGRSPGASGRANAGQAAGASAPGPSTIPALAAALALVVTPVGIVSNQLSRGFEARADSEALRITGDPDAAIAFQKRIALRNVSDPDPPGWSEFLFRTHPSTIDRIGIAEAYRGGAR